MSMNEVTQHTREAIFRDSTVIRTPLHHFRIPWIGNQKAACGLKSGHLPLGHLTPYPLKCSGRDEPSATYLPTCDAQRSAPHAPAAKPNPSALGDRERC